VKAKKLKVSKRTSSYVRKTLREYEELMLLGYTHDNFNHISHCLNRISDHLFQDELNLLGELWRQTYTDSCSMSEMQLAVAEIHDRF